MKKIFSTVALLFLGMVGVAQLRVYAKEYAICYRDDVTGLYSDCIYDTNFISRFYFDDLNTSFEHFVYHENLTSTYYIDSTINEVEKDVHYTTSDSGNKYSFVFDYKEKLVIIYPTDGSYSIATKIRIINFN